MMRFSDMLTEGISTTLYHWRLFESFYRMFLLDEFGLSAFASSPTEAKLKPKNNTKAYYGSFSRNTSNVFSNSSASAMTSSVIMVVDGDKLAQKYQGNPVEYFAPVPNVTSNRSRGDTEMEDRIFSDEPSIKKFFSSGYVKEVHIFVEGYWFEKDSVGSRITEDSPIDPVQFLFVLQSLHNMGIAVYIHSNIKEFRRVLTASRGKGVLTGEQFIKQAKGFVKTWRGNIQKSFGGTQGWRDALEWSMPNARRAMADLVWLLSADSVKDLIPEKRLETSPMRRHLLMRLVQNDKEEFKSEIRFAIEKFTHGKNRKDIELTKQFIYLRQLVKELTGQDVFGTNEFDYFATSVLDTSVVTNEYKRYYAKMLDPIWDAMKAKFQKELQELPQAEKEKFWINNL